MQPSDEIKSRLDIVDVIREYIQLKPAGMNFRAPCPFHKEKTPSFIVSPDKQIWHCFGCGKGGDIFSFVMEMEGASFIEALRDLAPKAGVTLKKGSYKESTQRNRLLDILELSTRFYNAVLRESPQAKKAREYLNKRGLGEDAIQDWQIGYSPDSWDSLIKVLSKKGYKEDELFLSGMTIKRDKRPGYYDRFRDRIMFPISDVNGNIVAFSARISPEKEAEEKMGKYINSPQTSTYDKSNILFGMDRAKLEIKKQGYAILVEGQMDVLTAHVNGFTNVVAASGTALTSQQTKLLKRYSNNLILAFDMDTAGEQAAERGIREAMSAEMNIKVMELPDGKDPDDYIREDKDGFKERIIQAKPMMKYFFSKVFTRINIKEVEGKRQAAAKLLPIIARLGNKIEQDEALKSLAQELSINENILRETFGSMIKPKEPFRRTAAEEIKPVKKASINRGEKLSELLLALLIKYPFLIEYCLNHFDIINIENENNKSLYKNIIFYYNKLIDEWTKGGGSNEPPILEYEDFKAWLLTLDTNTDNTDNNINSGQVNNTYQLSNLDRLVFLGDEEFAEVENEDAKSHIIKIIVDLKKISLTKRLKEIERDLAELEKSNDSDGIALLMDEFKALTAEIKYLEGDN